LRQRDCMLLMGIIPVSVSAPALAMPLVRDRQAQAVIAIPDNPSRAEEVVASDLQRPLGR